MSKVLRLAGRIIAVTLVAATGIFCAAGIIAVVGSILSGIAKLVVAAAPVLVCVAGIAAVSSPVIE